MVHIDRIADDTPIVIMGVAYVIPCFSLTPTAIDYREPNTWFFCVLFVYLKVVRLVTCYVPR